MNEQLFLSLQVAELQQLLADSEGDPVLEPQLRQRLAHAERELAISQAEKGQLRFAPIEIDIPRAAVFLRGGSVDGSFGIRPSLAGEVLTQYERMFSEQALHDEREAAAVVGRQRRRKGTPIPGLWFTGTPRGSFGLEFVPSCDLKDQATVNLHRSSLRTLATHVARITSEDTFETSLSEIPSKVLPVLKQFLGTLSQHNAELRFAFSEGSSISISPLRISLAAERLEREVTSETITVQGVFRGVTRESGVFDLRTSEGYVITGVVADDCSEEDLTRLHDLTNQNCTCSLQKTTIRRIGSIVEKFVLLDASESADQPKIDEGLQT